MRIVFYAEDSGDSDAWLAALRSTFADAQVRAWTEGDEAPADYAVVWKPPLAMLRARTDLKAIFNLGAGIDAILKFGDDLPAGVPLVRLDDAGMGMQMAEYVSHTVLRYFRRFDDYEAQARVHQWRALAPYDKPDFTVGILGMGVLGARIADALAQFEFPLRGWSRTAKTVAGVQCYAGAGELAAFLATTRVLVCALPLTEQTRGILNRATLGKLPAGARLINIARGAHLVEDDLLALLREGHLAGATLDVFEDEPLPPEHPFWREPRITITPHVAALTLREQSVRQIAEKVRALENGESIAGVVDRAKGY